MIARWKGLNETLAFSRGKPSLVPRCRGSASPGFVIPIMYTVPGIPPVPGIPQLRDPSSDPARFVRARSVNMGRQPMLVRSSCIAPNPLSAAAHFPRTCVAPRRYRPCRVPRS